MAERVASLYAEVTADTTNLERGMNRVRGELTNTGKATKDSGRNFTEMASKLSVAQQALGMTANAAKQVWGILEEGAAINLAADRFDNLSASIGTTSEAIMSGLSAATGGMVSNAELMASATSMISLGLAKTQAEVIDIVSLSSQLGWDQQQLVLTLANNSTMRLDALGLSMEDVKNRAKALEAQGYSTDKAFDMAVIEAGKAKLEMLGSAADTGAGAMQRLTVETENAKTAMMSFIAMRSEGAILGLANTIDAAGEATERGHSNLRNFLVILNEIDKTGGMGNGEGMFGGLIENLEASESAAVGAATADRALMASLAATAQAAQLEAERIGFSTEKMENYMSLEQMYGRQGEAIGESARLSWLRREEAMAAYGETLANGTGIENQYAAAAMESTANTNALAASLFRTAEAAAAEQAALLGTFTALSNNEEALADYATIMGGVRTVSIETSGATAEQKEEIERLQGIYDKAAGTIRDYEQGLKGIGMTEEKRNENIAEQQTLMANAQAAMAPLIGIQSEYTTVTDGGAAATELLNQKLFDQIAASSDSATAIALAGVALGVYTEQEAQAMVKSALLEEQIRKQAEAWDGTAAGLQTIQGNIQGYIDILNSTPDVITTTFVAETQGSPPPWAGAPSSGDTGESDGSWGGEVSDFAAGGIVSGGVPGRDSVPALLMPGEEVLPVNSPRNSRNGGGGNKTFNWVVNVNSFDADREQRNANAMFGGV